MKKAGDMVWSYALDDADEVWRGECATREDAIAEAKTELTLDLRDPTFFVNEFRRPAASRYVLRAEELLEMASERAYDDCGEASEDWPDVSDEATKALDAMLKAWAAEHCDPVPFWVSFGKPEKITLDALPAEHTAAPSGGNDG